MKAYHPNESRYYWLRVTFLHIGQIIQTVYMTESQAVRNIARWMGRGIEFTVKQELVKLGRFSPDGFRPNSKPNCYAPFTHISEASFRRFLKEERPECEEFFRRGQ